LHGLSTSVANQRLVEEVEVIIRRYLERVKVVDLKARLSFLQTHEGAGALVCAVVFAAIAAVVRDWKVLGEVAFILPFHGLAWYISFRLPRVEQLRAIAKVQECIHRFVASEDAFTISARGGHGPTHPEALPPSSFCVSVLRDRCWRRIPYNMIVEGDVFRLRDGDIFPCRAERLAVRPPYGAVPSGEPHFEAGANWIAGRSGATDIARAVSDCDRTAPVSIGSFRALSTACMPLVHKFLNHAQRSLDGRMDTVFFELADLVRARMRTISVVAFIITAAAFSAWLAQPAVAEQSLNWHLQRALLPFRLTVCLLPLMPVILLQITDVWGNARIQSLFEWHAGVGDEEQRKVGVEGVEGPTSGEIDASRVPLRRQLRELLDILRQGLDGPSNLMHTLNSTTVVCFCDKEGLLTDTCTMIHEVCLCATTTEEPSHASLPGSLMSKALQPAAAGPTSITASPQSKGASADASSEAEEAGSSTFLPVVLDVQPDMSTPCGLRFEDSDWRSAMPMLKPLGLAMAATRQPVDPADGHEKCGHSTYDLTVRELLGAMQQTGCAAMHDCLCNVSKLVGFSDQVLAGFQDVKFSMELRKVKKSQEAESQPAVCRAFTGIQSQSDEGADAANANTPSGGATTTTEPGYAKSMSYSDADLSPVQGKNWYVSEVDREGATNFSQTLMTWFVRDTRDNSEHMFCKAKPKRLLPCCTHYFNGTKVVPLAEEDRQALLRLVLQWKASGLSAIAYSFRPLSSTEELDISASLVRHSIFYSQEDEDGGKFVATKLDTSSSETLQEQVAQLQSQQVLIGMAGVKLCASVQMASYAEALHSAGIRFQVYSAEAEKRTRTLGMQLGLETGWNCLISLETVANEWKNMMGQVVLPSGIPNIRKHVKEVDNVPLLVGLYSKATPYRAKQMMSILQENGECVTCVGSALQPNFETFRQANNSVSVLVGAVPQCSRCFGSREPRGGVATAGDGLLAPSTVGRAEFQLSADLTSLPCALQARHSYSNGEQRTLGVLFHAIKEARRCVDCILMVLMHYICGAVQLAIVVTLQSVLCLPAPLEGVHLEAFLFLLLPVLSFALLFNKASPQLMKELPLKKADERTLAQPNRLMFLYAVRCVPTALVVTVAFVHDLHRVFSWQLSEVRREVQGAAFAAGARELGEACEGFGWVWWLTGQWPRCMKSVTKVAAEVQAVSINPTSMITSPDCAVVHAQQWASLLYVIYTAVLAFTFLDRYDSLLTRGPASNKVLCGTVALTLLAHAAVGYSVVYFSCGMHQSDITVPNWEVWLIYVGAWPMVAVLVSECTKRRDRRYHMDLQRTLRVLFNTRLGMWSPK